jgi:hypothetical protein
MIHLAAIAASSGYEYVLDRAPISSYRAYSTRMLRAANKDMPCMDVYNGSTTTTETFGFRNGVLDTKGIASFLGAATGLVSRWYDLSGNGAHLPQSDASRMPRIANGGVITFVNGRPVIEYHDANRRLPFDTNMAAFYRNVSWAEFWGVMQAGSTTARRDMFAFQGNTATGLRILFLTNVGTANRAQLFARRLDAGPTVNITSDTNHGNALLPYNCRIEYSSGRGVIRQNGADVANDASFITTGSTSDTDSFIDTASANNSSAVGLTTVGQGGLYVPELILTNSDPGSTNRAIIEADQIEFWRTA